MIFELDKKRFYFSYNSILYDSESNEISTHSQTQAELMSSLEGNTFSGFEFDSTIIQNFSEIINVRCPHVTTAIKMIERIKEVKSMNDSIGGIATGVIYNTPKAIGEPCFDKFEAVLAMAMLSLPATKGFEFGSGFDGTKLLGSQHNDVFKNTSIEE